MSINLNSTLLTTNINGERMHQQKRNTTGAPRPSINFISFENLSAPVDNDFVVWAEIQNENVLFQALYIVYINCQNTRVARKVGGHPSFLQLTETQTSLNLHHIRWCFGNKCVTNKDDTTRDSSLTSCLVKALCYLLGSCPRRNDVSQH